MVINWQIKYCWMLNFDKNNGHIKKEVDDIAVNLVFVSNLGKTRIFPQTD